MKTLILVAATLVAFGQAALADATSYNCSQKMNGKNVNVVATVIPGGAYDVKLILNGQEVPVAGGRCFESNRPSTNYVLCSFKTPGFELDIYPWARTTSGAINVMRYVLWTGEQASTAGRFTNCSSN